MTLTLPNFVIIIVRGLIKQFFVKKKIKVYMINEILHESIFKQLQSDRTFHFLHFHNNEAKIKRQRRLTFH